VEYLFRNFSHEWSFGDLIWPHLTSSDLIWPHLTHFMKIRLVSEWRSGQRVTRFSKLDIIKRCCKLTCHTDCHKPTNILAKLVHSFQVPVNSCAAAFHAFAQRLSLVVTLRQGLHRYTTLALLNSKQKRAPKHFVIEKQLFRRNKPFLLWFCTFFQSL